MRAGLAGSVLLVLPSVAPSATLQAWTVTTTMLNTLQAPLGAAVRVIRSDAASRPAVVRSFDGRGLPAYGLLEHGTEVWWQQGMPEGESMVGQLLSKLHPAAEPPA